MTAEKAGPFMAIDALVMRLEDEGYPFEDVIDMLAEYVAIADEIEADHYASL